MKKLCICLILVSVLTGCTGPMKALSFTGESESYTFTWDAPDDAYLTQLRTEFALDELTADCENDLERVLAITDWVHNLWEHDGSNEPEQPDPISILREAAQGERFRCVELQKTIAEQREITTLQDTGESPADYLKWIWPYLFYFDVKLDNCIADRGCGESLMLVPDGAGKPHVFQRKRPIEDMLYTHSLGAFYPKPEVRQPLCRQHLPPGLHGDIGAIGDDPVHPHAEQPLDDGGLVHGVGDHFQVVVMAERKHPGVDIEVIGMHVLDQVFRRQMVAHPEKREII